MTEVIENNKDQPSEKHTTPLLDAFEVLVAINKRYAEGGWDFSKAIELLEQELQKRSENKAGYVNSLRVLHTKSSQKRSAVLDVTEDSPMLLLRMYKTDNDGNILRYPKNHKTKPNKPITTAVRCLIDSGATISCIAKAFIDKNAKQLHSYVDKTATPISVTFANDVTENSGRILKGVKFIEDGTRAQLCPPVVQFSSTARADTPRRSRLLVGD